MGESFDQVQNEIKRVAYEVVRGDNNTPRVVIDNRQYSPTGNFCHDFAENEENGRRLSGSGSI